MSYNGSLNPNNNYPIMSQSEWDNAPFNQPDPPTKPVDVYVEQTLAKSSHLSEADYDPYDESFVDLRNSYMEECETPITLIGKFKESLKKGMFPPNKDYWIKQCSKWIETDTIIEEE